MGNMGMMGMMYLEEGEVFEDEIHSFDNDPPVNVWDDESRIYVAAQLPGVKLENIELYITKGNNLTIKGTKNIEEKNWHLREWGYGKFDRVVELPSWVDSEKVDAAFNNGILNVTLLKSTPIEPKKIVIK